MRRNRRRRRTRSDEGGGRTDIGRGVGLANRGRGPLAGYGNLWRMGQTRAAGYRRPTNLLGYVALAGLILVAVLALIALVSAAISALR
jgi:hypothetical protein